MTDRRTVLTTIVGTAALVTLLVPNLADAAPDKDVRVVNTPAEAVPVSVQGTPTVGVKNSAGDPLFVQETGGAVEERFQQFLSAFNASVGGEDCASVEVPADKTLRIEAVSIETKPLGSATKPTVYLRVDHNFEGGGSFVRILGAEVFETRPGATWSANYRGPLFALPDGSVGEDVHVCAGSETEVRAFVSGYLVD